MKTAALADVCEIVMGQAPKGDTYNTDGVGLPLIAGAGDFGDLHPSVTKSTTADRVRTCQSGDIVLSIRASIGTKVLADGEYCLGRGVAGLRAGRDLDDRYLWHWTTAAAPMLAAKGRGATFLQVNKADISELEIPVPPIEEQRRIAAVLDAADELRAKRRDALAKLDTLSQAIFIDMFGDGESWPANSKTYSLGELEDAGFVQIGRGKVISRKDIEADPGDYPVYSSAELLNGEFGRYGKYMFDEELVTWSVDGGGHLFYRPRHRFSVTNVGGWIRVLDKSRLCTRYLHSALVLLHSRLTFDWTQKAHSSVVRRVYASVLVPPLAEQLAFAERVGVVDEIRECMKDESRTLDQLVASLQQRAFRGEL